MRFNTAEIVFEDIAGEMGKGRLDGRLTVANGATVTRRAAPRARRRRARRDLSGHRSSGDVRPSRMQTEIEGVGRSPAAFIGSLTGFGNVTLEQARLGGLNPDVFGAVTRADRAWDFAERQSDSRIRRWRCSTTPACRCRRLRPASASAHGQARFATSSVQPTGADLQAIVNVDLADAMLDALLTLNATAVGAGARGRRCWSRSRGRCRRRSARSISVC